MPFPIEDFVDVYNISTNTQATNQLAMIAPFDMDVVQIEERHRVASTSGTLDVTVVPDGTVITGGTSILNSTVSLSGVADTKVVASLKTGINQRRVNKGQALAFIFGGTLTNLADACIAIYFRQLKKR